MIPVNTPLLCGNEKKYLSECIDSGWISSEGPFVSKFEKLFAARVGREFGVAVTNGTAALQVACDAINLQAGDEVIMPSFTIVSCANAIISVGATPVLVDAHPKSWNMDVGAIEDKITANTRAILVVHIYGMPVDMDPILELARKYNLKVIEDAAEAIGLQYKGRECGSFGDISCFSFYPNKHITTGEGGMVVMNDPALYESCKSLRNLCFQEKQRFVHERMGWNFRMTNIQAALGLAQLEQLDNFLVKKREIGNFYYELLSNHPKLEFQEKCCSYADNIYWVFGLVLKESAGMDAKEMAKRLSMHKIGTRPFFWPMHKQPIFARMGLFEGESYPVSERLATHGLYLPSGLALTKDDVRTVVGHVQEILQ
ncbi:MAG: DegT/DnrJ/EryC1/StrS family aminotransferase [Oligoflexia bacterium]|nr:DegT/DnrJ/EryC1/StrS family aminotransferase [Oligoflexia bacterium]